MAAVFQNFLCMNRFLPPEQAFQNHLQPGDHMYITEGWFLSFAGPSAAPQQLQSTGLLAIPPLLFSILGSLLVILKTDRSPSVSLLVLLLLPGTPASLLCPESSAHPSRPIPTTTFSDAPWSVLLQHTARVHVCSDAPRASQQSCCCLTLQVGTCSLTSVPTRPGSPKAHVCVSHNLDLGAWRRADTHGT